MKYLFVFFVILGVFYQKSWAQQDGLGYFREVELRIDTLSYSFRQTPFRTQTPRHVAFAYQEETPSSEILLYPLRQNPIDELRLLPNSTYEMLDSIQYLGEYFRAKIRFKPISKTEFPTLVFEIREAGQRKSMIREIKLFPYTQTVVQVKNIDTLLYIGEEKVFPIHSNKPENLRISEEWTKDLPIDYKFSQRDGKFYLHLLPNRTGQHKVKAHLATRKPYLGENGQFNYTFPEIKLNFTVRSSRLAFLNLDPKEITLDGNEGENIEIQIDDNHKLKLQKTYRVESQESTGGKLVAEIFTRSRLAKDKILCWIRPYRYHRKTEGHLYLKDGDEAKFISNLDIWHKPKIRKISILRENGEWTENLGVYAGEAFDLKIEGEALDKTIFQFESLNRVRLDSSIRTENVIVYRLQVPLDIANRQIRIYDRQMPTPFALLVREIQKPRPLDFVELNLGQENNISLAELKEPLLHGKTIRDLAISFDSRRLDSANSLFGKQYLSIDVRITSARNELIEMRNIDNIVVCPAESSVRGRFYDNKDCNSANISLNTILGRKIYDLEDWSKIEMTFRHKTDKYGGKGASQRVDIFLQRRSAFDIDLSFPGGLILKKIGVPDFGTLNGISMAVLAQFKFYKAGKINQLRPFRIGFGTLAFNVFNFSDQNINRDLGIVALGSVFPTRKDVKITLPLYAGFGYLLKEEKWFFVLGPGLRINL